MSNSGTGSSVQNNVANQDVAKSRSPKVTSSMPVSQTPEELVDRVLEAMNIGDREAGMKAQEALTKLPKPMAGDSKNAVDLNKIGLSNLKAKKYAEAAADFNPRVPPTNQILGGEVTWVSLK